MEKLNFYTVDLDYVSFLKDAEMKKRGFIRVPDLDSSNKHKRKFLSGIVLKINDMNYFVPVSSCKQKKPDNFLILDTNGQSVSSLRFNYMFPVPEHLPVVRKIDQESDQAYQTLLAQMLLYCTKNQQMIQYLAKRTYKRVLLGKDPGLVTNSCDFLLLEDACRNYITDKPASNED